MFRTSKDKEDLKKAYKQAANEARMNAEEARRQGKNDRAKQYEQQSKQLEKAQREDCRD